jgi:alpha-tubulin suppressor-like RCC1 family protein
VPKPTVPFLTVSQVSCGGMHSVALTTSGHVWQWGEPWGDFSMEVNRSPRKLAVDNVLSISSGAFHNLALDSSNEVRAGPFAAAGASVGLRLEDGPLICYVQWRQ